MKIGHTRTHTRISLTQSEYEHLGSPTHGSAILLGADGRLKIIGGTSGSQVYPQATNSTHPWAFSLRRGHEFGKGRPFFGSEVVGSRHSACGAIYSDPPKMDVPVMDRSYGRRPTSVAKPTPTSPPEVSLKTAVEVINRHKDTLGRDLVISIDADGFLELLHRTGR